MDRQRYRRPGLSLWEKLKTCWLFCVDPNKERQIIIDLQKKKVCKNCTWLAKGCGYYCYLIWDTGLEYHHRKGFIFKGNHRAVFDTSKAGSMDIWGLECPDFESRFSTTQFN